MTAGARIRGFVRLAGRSLRVRPRSARCRNLVRTDFVDHSHLSGAAKRIAILAEILFGQRIDVRIGTLFGDLNDLSSYGNIAIGVFWILDRKRNPLVAAHVLVLHAPLRGMPPYMSAIIVYSNRRYRRTASRHQRRWVC